MASATEGFLESIDRRCVAVTQRVAFIGVLAMLFIAFTTIADVAMRWLFNSPIDGLSEIEGMALAVAVAGCFPAGAALRVNLTIDLIGGRVTATTQAWLKALGGLALLTFYVLIAWRIGEYAYKLGARNAETVYVQLPIAPFMWAVATFLAISAVVQLINFIVSVKYALAGIPDPSGWAIENGEKPVDARPVVKVDTALLSTVVIGALAVTAVILWGIYVNMDSLTQIGRNYPGTLALGVVFLVWVLLVLYVPLAVALGLLGILCSAIMIGLEPALNVLGNESAQFLSNSQVAVVPMFLMMGSFAVVAGMSEDIYDLAHSLFSHFRGGLALATIGGCGGFGALTGSSLATVATIGRVALPEMRARGYSAELATGCVAAGGTLGALVPPSIPLIFYAFLTETSIGQLFVAAMIPAALAIGLYLLAIAVQVRLVPSSAPATSATPSFADIGRAMKKAWAAILLFGIVLGGIYGGIFTETEAAAVGAVGAFITAVLRGRLTRESVLRVMGETTATTALLYFIIFGVLTFSFSMGVTGLPQRMTTFFQDLNWAPIAVIGMLLVIYLILGCIMDSNTIMFVTVPIVAPLVAGMNYDLIWWGIVNLVVLETGLITPPFGIHLFVLKSIVGSDAPLGVVYRGVIPFVIADITKLVLLVAFPVLTLWLPSTMMAK
ncbi:MAG: TRAP transporter large permease subunit [Burkholderiales bacterium]